MPRTYTYTDRHSVTLSVCVCVLPNGVRHPSAQVACSPVCLRTSDVLYKSWSHSATAAAAAATATVDKELSASLVCAHGYTHTHTHMRICVSPWLCGARAVKRHMCVAGVVAAANCARFSRVDVFGSAQQNRYMALYIIFISLSSSDYLRLRASRRCHVALEKQYINHCIVMCASAPAPRCCCVHVCVLSG